MKVADLFALLSIEVDKESINKTDKLLDNLKKTVKRVAIAFAGAATGAALMIDRTAQMADRYRRLEDEINVNAQAMQGWEYAASLAGLELDNVVDFMGDLTEKAVEAAEGNENFRKAFRDMGVQIKDGNGNLKDTATLALDVAEAMKNMDDKQKRTQLTMMLFSDEGRKMIPVLAEGREGIERLTAEYEAMGGIISDEGLEQFRQTKQEMDRVKMSIGALKNQIILAALPAIKEFAKGISAWAKQNRELIKTRLTQALKGLVAMLTLLGKAIIFSLKHYRMIISLFIAWKGVTYALAAAQWFLGQKSAKAALITMWGWIKALAPLLLMVAVVIAIALLIEDIWGAFTGKESLIGEVVGFIKDAFWDAVNTIKLWLADLWDSFVERAKKAKDRVVNYFLGKSGQDDIADESIRSTLRGKSPQEALRIFEASGLGREGRYRQLYLDLQQRVAAKPAAPGSIGAVTGRAIDPTAPRSIMPHITNNIQTTDPDRAAREVIDNAARLIKALK